MKNLLCHPGRTFTLDELDDQTKAARKSASRKLTEALSVSGINLNPVSDPQELEFLAGLVPFHRIPSKLLFKLVRVATGLKVRDRWVAVRAIIARRIPIPVRSLSETSSTAEQGFNGSHDANWLSQQF